VTIERLNTISKLFDSEKLLPQVGTVLSISQVHTAHEMLAGKPHSRGKIVLQIATP
jgi:NADPH:quinone reductase-like Zn-dependent oxidoreductase